MPEERTSWTKQTQQRRQPPKWDLPSWLWRPEMVQERYRQQPTPTAGGAPWFPPISPVEVAEREERRGAQEFMGTEAGVAWGERIDRQNLIAQIRWYLGRVGDVAIPPPDYETGSIQEFRSYLEALQRAERGQAGGQAGRQGLGGAWQGRADIPRNVQSIIQQAESLGMNVSGFAEEYANAPTTSAKGYMLSGFTKAVNFQFDAQQIRKSHVMAREFPEKFAEMEAERVKASPFHWQYRYDVDARDVFQSWWAGQPGGEEAKRAWEVKQYTEYPTVYPWYLEAGGIGTDKTLQEWIKSEPLATAYVQERQVKVKEEALAEEKRETEEVYRAQQRAYVEKQRLAQERRGRIPSPTRWQPAYQR